MYKCPAQSPSHAWQEHQLTYVCLPCRYVQDNILARSNLGDATALI